MEKDYNSYPKQIGTTAYNIAPTPTNANQTLSTPTAPSQIRTAPCTHQRVTRANTPAMIPTTLTPHSEQEPTKLSESVTIPNSEGECASMHSTPPPWRWTILRTTVRQPIQTPQNLTPSEVSPPNLNMPNYIMQESMNAISVPTQTAPTPLQHLCAPFIHPITG